MHHPPTHSQTLCECNERFSGHLCQRPCDALHWWVLSTAHLTRGRQDVESLNPSKSCAAALVGGKHVLVDKPMAMNAAEGERMLAAASAHSKQVRSQF